MLSKLKSYAQLALAKIPRFALGLMAGYFGHPFIKAGLDAAFFLIKHL